MFTQYLVSEYRKIKRTGMKRVGAFQISDPKERFKQMSFAFDIGEKQV